MKLKRFYFEPHNRHNNEIILTEDEFLHAVTVLRIRVGEEVVAFCGDGFDYYCKVKNIAKKELTLEISKTSKNLAEPSVNLTVFQALVKGEKLKLIVQKLTELGVANFITFYSKFCDVKSNTNKLEKLDKVAISASKQCGRSVVTKCNQTVFALKDLPLENFDAVLLAYENADDKNLVCETQRLAKHNVKNVALIVGPEGGFSDDEVEFLESKNVITVSLGKRILRAETCSIVASGIIIQMLENLQK